MAVTTDPNAVFYSYRGIGNKIVNKFIRLLDKKGIPHRGAESETIEGELTDFEEQIGAANIIVIFYSQDYFESEHCMNEYANIRKYENDARKNTTYYVKCENFKFEDILDKLTRLWCANLAVWKGKKRETLKPINQRSLDNGCYIDENTSYCIQKLDNYFSKKVRYNESTLQALVDLIEKKYHELSSKNTSTTEGKTISIAPSFRVPRQSNLVERDSFVNNLHTLVRSNRFSNLYGFGGSGKTSLTYLFLDKYRNDYNQIAYVVVNNNIRADFVSQINDTIHLFKHEDRNNSLDEIQDLDGDSNKNIEHDKYKSVISYLESNYKSDKPNLIILDINNANDTTKFCEELSSNTLRSNKIYPDGWKYLMVSRGKLFKGNTIALNLNEEETEKAKDNTDFLKELFLTKTGAKYNDFGDNNFAELFETISYSPLMAEQLGVYLQDLPQKTLSKIKALRHREYFQNEEHTGIIVFDNFKVHQKEILRHFILWPSDYISQNVILKLLNGIFKDKDELEEVLTTLVKRSVINSQKVGNTLEYKLHGLIAESLSNQIDVIPENYSYYLDNINKIKEYDNEDFAPFGECIGNSLSLFDICNDNNFLLNIAYKLHQSSIINNAALLYEKVIDKIKQSPNGIEEQSILAHAYNYYAVLQQYEYKDYTTAEANYKNAIEIGEKLPSENEECQYYLASALNNLANLQNYQLSDHNSAEENYKKSIEIGKKLPQNNQILDILARTFNNLANLQKKKRNYSAAENNYIMSIRIGEKLPKGNPTYQYALARTYNNLAVMQFRMRHLLLSAEENFNNVVKIINSLPTDSSEYLYILARAYDNLSGIRFRKQQYILAEMDSRQSLNIIGRLPKDILVSQIAFVRTVANALAKLQINMLDDYKAAEETYKKATEILEQLSQDNTESQKELANAFRDLAHLQNHYLNDHTSAILNYYKAQQIENKLPTKEQQSRSLSDRFGEATRYMGEGLHLANQLNDYSTAEISFVKVIEILKGLPQDRLRFQSFLATNYRHLAYTYDKQNKYEQAMTAINDAINVSLQLKEKDSKYLPHWLRYRYYRAEIQFNNKKDIDQVKSTLFEIKPLVQQCINDYPDNNYIKEVNDGIDKILSAINA